MEANLVIGDWLMGMAVVSPFVIIIAIRAWRENREYEKNRAANWADLQMRLRSQYEQLGATRCDKGSEQEWRIQHLQAECKDAIEMLEEKKEHQQ